METKDRDFETQETVETCLASIIDATTDSKIMDAIRWSHCLVRKMGIDKIGHLCRACYEILFRTHLSIENRNLRLPRRLLNYPLTSVKIDFGENGKFTAVVVFEDGYYDYVLDFTEKSLRLSAKERGEVETLLSLWIPYRDYKNFNEDLIAFCPMIYKLKQWVDSQHKLYVF